MCRTRRFFSGSFSGRNWFLVKMNRKKRKKQYSYTNFEKSKKEVKFGWNFRENVIE